MAKELRAELRRVFDDWIASRMTAQAVQNWARATSTKGADPYCVLLVEHLRGLGEYLITCDDIPTYLAGFDMEPEKAVAWLGGVSAIFDVKQRATDLRDDPFYGPHTRAILRDIS